MTNLEMTFDEFFEEYSDNTDNLKVLLKNKADIVITNNDKMIISRMKSHENE